MYELIFFLTYESQIRAATKHTNATTNPEKISAMNPSLQSSRESQETKEAETSVPESAGLFCGSTDLRFLDPSSGTKRRFLQRIAKHQWQQSNTTSAVAGPAEITAANRRTGTRRRPKGTAAQPTIGELTFHKPPKKKRKKQPFAALTQKQLSSEYTRLSGPRPGWVLVKEPIQVVS